MCIYQLPFKDLHPTYICGHLWCISYLVVWSFGTHATQSSSISQFYFVFNRKVSLKMEVKKKTFLENLRMKTKLNLKKPRKKQLDKQPRRLAHRRSISVPDLRFVPGEAFSAESALVSAASEAIFFGVSPGASDTDSIASGITADGALFADKLDDSVSETSLRVPTDAALYRMSAPAETLMLYEEIKDTINSEEQRIKENKVNVAQEGLYAQVDKKAKGNVPMFSIEPIPAPRSIFTNPMVSSVSLDLEERESLDGEDPRADRVLSSSVSAVLARASSMGDQGSTFTEKKTTSFEPRKASSEKGTPPVIKRAPADRVSLMVDAPGNPAESADGISLDSPCGTPIDERVSMPWTTDSEELEREPCSPLLVRSFSSEEALLEVAQSEEALEEVSFITGVLFTFSQICNRHGVPDNLNFEFQVLNKSLALF